jgi:hypothetical protein
MLVFGSLHGVSMPGAQNREFASDYHQTIDNDLGVLQDAQSDLENQFGSLSF